jgi:hypothetical protein
MTRKNCNVEQREWEAKQMT